MRYIINATDDVVEILTPAGHFALGLTPANVGGRSFAEQIVSLYTREDLENCCADERAAIDAFLSDIGVTL